MRALAAALAAALSLGAGAARAAGPYDPEVRYLTLTTPNFAVVHPEGYEHLALRAAEIAERSRPYLAERLGWEPDGRITIVLDDQTDFANGSATVVPNKLVTVYVTAPTRVSGLEDYDDWLSTVLVHELAHVFHLDMAFGLPRAGRLLLGKYVSMNAYNPAWVTEGLAVAEETRASGGGRGRSAYVDMVLRTAALEGRFPTIDQGYRGFARWPFGNVAYFFGGRFQLWLSDRYGEDRLRRYHRAYASNPIPFFTWLPARIAFGTSLESLWITFAKEQAEEAARVLEQVRTSTRGLTTPERLTFHGGESVGPRYTPDGRRIVYSTSSPVDGPRVRWMASDGSDDAPLVNDALSEAVSFAPGGGAFYFQQAEINQRFYLHNSLLRYDLAAGRLDRLALAPDAPRGDFVAPSGSLRARDPDVSPDGRRLVFVQAPYGANRLVLAELLPDGLGLRPRVIVPAEPDVQLSSPRFSPDGTRIALSRFRGGRRDVVVHDLEGRLVLEVTRDRAQDVDPTWSPDGRWLLFASDRGGIYDLYAWDLERARRVQLTRVITGAFQPAVSPDGRHVVFRGYSADGFDVYRVPFEPERGVEVARGLEPELALDTRERAWPPMDHRAPPPPPPAPFRGAPLPASLPGGWSLGAYSPLPTLLPFNDNWNLFPALVANEREVLASVTTFGADALQTHGYVAQLSYGSLTGALGGGFAYTYDALEPTFGVSGSADAVTFGGALLTAPPAGEPCAFGEVEVGERRLCYGSEGGLYNERRMRASLSLSLPVLQRHLVSMSYVLERRAPLDPLPEGTVEALLPRRGRFARVQLGYTYRNVRAFPYSISPERGPAFAVALSALSRSLGGEHDQLLLTAEGRYYLDLPWRARGLTNHVLAARLGVGAGLGDARASLFRLGGVAGASALTTTTENFFGLRGLGTARLFGAAVIAGSAEYRAPLFRVDRGVGTLPLALRVVHAAAFADAGAVLERVELEGLGRGLLDGLALGVGAELRADLLLTHAIPLTVRLGWATPLVAPARDDPRLLAPGPYFQLGSQF